MEQALLQAWNDAGGFDGILGFSNGAAAAFLLSVHLAQASCTPAPPPMFVILAGGYPPEPLSCLVPENLIESDGGVLKVMSRQRCIGS